VKPLNDLLDDGWSLMPLDSNDISSALKLIREEINKLHDEQHAALKSAAYLGMTPAIAKQCDERRLHITALMQKMMDLQRSAQPTESSKIPDLVSLVDTDETSKSKKSLDSID
jgi:hypothetical protein